MKAYLVGSALYLMGAALRLFEDYDQLILRSTSLVGLV